MRVKRQSKPDHIKLELLLMKKLMSNQLNHPLNLDNIKLKPSHSQATWIKLILVQNMNSKQTKTQHLDNIMLMLLKEQPWPDHTKLRLLVMKMHMYDQLRHHLNLDNIKLRQSHSLIKWIRLILEESMNLKLIEIQQWGNTKLQIQWWKQRIEVKLL